MVAAIGAVTMVGAVGCDGSSVATRSTSTAPAASSHTAFVAQVEAVCQKAIRAHAGHSFPVVGFDPLHPDPNQLPTVGEYFAHYGGMPTTVMTLHQLTPPPSDAATWQAMLATADAMVANAQRQINAARRKDVPTFVETVRSTDELARRIDTAGNKFGLPAQSACGQVFG